MRILLIALIILSTPFYSLSQEKESKPTITKKDIRYVYFLCGLDSLCTINKCQEIYSDKELSNDCSEKVIEFVKEENNESLSKADKWIKIDSNSEMDDSKTVSLILDANNYIDAYYNKSEKPTLIIRCKENKTEIYIRTNVSANPELGLYNEFTVRIRLDKNKPFKQRWGESTNGEALFAPRAIALAKKINKSKKMLFEFTPYNSNSQLAEFDVRGLEPYLKELADTCNWKL